MRTRMSRSFWWQVAALLFLACAVILSVMLVVHCSVGEGFLETAARTNILLSVVSFVLLCVIAVFFCYVACRRRKPS